MVMTHNTATAANVTATAQRIMMPMIRKIMPQMLAQQIVGVQPMPPGTGSIFTQRYGKTFNPKYWPYQVEVTGGWEHTADAQRWCYDTIKCRYWKNSGMRFVFKREADATMFALKWA